jgi:hypothetical protein
VTPSVGRIVHYVSVGTPGGEYASECRAAIVTAVGTLLGYQPGRGEVDSEAEVVDLAVLNPTGLFFNQGVPEDQDGKAGGTWHWPERVEASG